LILNGGFRRGDQAVIIASGSLMLGVSGRGGQEASPAGLTLVRFCRK